MSLKTILFCCQLFLFIYSCVLCDFDEWRYINSERDVSVIAVNNKALYIVKTDAHLYILEKDIGFEYISHSILDVDVNDDYGLWVTNPNKAIYFRDGITSSNMKGTGWVHVPGGLQGITTGRQGLVFGHDVYRRILIRTGLSRSLPQGTGWHLSFGANINRESCGHRVCFCVTTQNGMWTTGLLRNIYSPIMLTDWVYIYPNIKDISAYGTKTLWMIDTAGDAWEAVDILDSNFIKLNWQRRGYQAKKFKDIAVTDKIAFAVTTDGLVYVRTGCPIFDFEDDDISAWQQTGTAFSTQPVVGQTANGFQSGKIGHRLIDTISNRKNYDMPDDASTLAGDAPVGTLTSPPFQIRNSILHFYIGGGSHPSNYASLVVDNSEVRVGSGASKTKVGATAQIRLGWYWWDVTELINKCAKIKLTDSATGAFGHTVFDDLRSGPPCFKTMSAVWTMTSHIQTVGEIVEHSIDLKGFYTSKLRMLTITASFPSLDGVPLVYYEKANITWNHCNTKVDMTDDRFPTSSSQPTKVIIKIKDLLSDAKLVITARINDHQSIQQKGIHAMASISIDYTEEYMKIMKKNLTLKRHGNETASLVSRTLLNNKRNYTVGENISVEMKIWHHQKTTQRGYNIMVRIYIPPYMSLLDVHGMNGSMGDKSYSLSISEHIIEIPELLLGSLKRLTINLSIRGDQRWKRRANKFMQGKIIFDVTYCVRKGCKDIQGVHMKTIMLLTNKIHEFKFAYKYDQPVRSRYVFTTIVESKESLIFFCGPYKLMQKMHCSNCFLMNATDSMLQPMAPMLSNITYYDSTNKELYGIFAEGLYIKLYGDGFKNKHMLTKEQWNSVLSKSSSFVKPTNVLASLTKESGSNNNIMIDGGNGFKIALTSYGVKLQRQSSDWTTKLHWQCCH